MEYELHIENSLGNSKIASFFELDVLLKFTEDNPPKRNYYYYVVVVEYSRIRRNLTSLINEMVASEQRRKEGIIHKR